MHTALTIAGSDPGGGAGIQADLKTFAAHRVYGTTAITALTVQSSQGVTKVRAVDPAFVTAQIDAIVSDFGADATKIGMLANADIVEAVADAIQRHRLPHVVLDPVRRATTGPALLDDAGMSAMIELLIPVAAVFTPNAVEASEITGAPVTSLEEQRRAAAALVARGARSVVVKGGHISGPTVIDVLYDGREFHEFRSDRIESRHTHGTGCTFSSAIAAHLALGDDLVTAVGEAKRYVHAAIAQAPGLGRGRGPLQHFPA